MTTLSEVKTYLVSIVKNIKLLDIIDSCSSLKSMYSTVYIHRIELHESGVNLGSIFKVMDEYLLTMYNVVLNTPSESSIVIYTDDFISEKPVVIENNSHVIAYCKDVKFVLKNGSTFYGGYNQTVKAGEHCSVSMRGKGRLKLTNNSNAKIYGEINCIAFGNSKVIAKDDCRIVANDQSEVLAFKDCVVTAHGHSIITGCDTSEIKAFENTDVTGFNFCTAVLLGESIGRFTDNCHVTTHNSVTITISNKVICDATDESVVKASGNSFVALTGSATAYIDDEVVCVAKQQSVVTIKSERVRVDAHDTSYVKFSANGQCDLYNDSYGVQNCFEDLTKVNTYGESLLRRRVKTTFQSSVALNVVLKS